MDAVGLGEVAEFVNGRAFKPSDWSTTGLPIIRIQNLTGSNKSFHYFDGEVQEKHLVKKGDILISWSASLGVYIWQETNAVLNQHIFKVNLNGKKIDRKYFYYVTQNAISEMKRHVHGSTMQHITKEPFIAIQIPLPPLDEQRRIAAILDRVDDLRWRRLKTISKLQELVGSALGQLIGRAPKHVLFREVASIDRKPASDEEKQTLPYLGLEAMESHSGKILGPLQPLSMKSGNFRFSPNHVLYGKLRPYLNKVAIASLDGVCTTEILPLLPGKELDKYYLWAYLKSSSFVTWASNKVSGAQLPRLSPTQLEIAPIPLPSISEQQKLARTIKHIKAIEFNLDQHLHTLNKLYYSLAFSFFK